MKIDHIYCVNLERSKNRRLNMETEFEREKLEVEFFKACDGKEQGKDGAFGCAQSHIQIWRDIVKHGYENALILEDDVKLVSNFKIKLEELEEPHTWDILYLFRIGEIVGSQYNDFFHHGKSLSTAGYIISNKCATRLHLLEYEDMGCSIDEFLSVKLTLNNFISKTKLISININDTINSEIGFSPLRFLKRWALEYWTEWLFEKFGWAIFIFLIVILIIRLKTI